MSKRKLAWLISLIALLPVGSGAQPLATLQDVVKKAVVSNPEVQARWHAFLSSRYEQDVARGRYFPQLDLIGSTGRQTLTQPSSATTNFNTRGAELTLSQMVYDGFATRNEVAKMAYAKLVRYYELLDTSESTALDATQAYLDVLRQRELMVLTQENLAQHQAIFNQIQERYKAGVGRGVDLEQAGGRLALAHSNTLTEASNLHDVTARFLRIVGELPAEEMLAPRLLDQDIPPSVEDAVKQAFQGSPVFNAAVENVRSAQADARGRQAGFHPRVDLRASKNVSYNDNGIEGRRDDQTIGLVLNYNLYKGGSDLAQVRQYGERLKLSREQRDTTCRNVRQTVTIAYNDIHSLTRQMDFLDQHQLAIEKAREAYRQQFDIGQRSLLDLLNTENEYFTARRAYANATYDHAIAHARTLAGMGKLLSTLEVGRDGMPTVKGLGQERLEIDPADQCPATAPLASTSNLPPPAMANVTSTPRKINAAPARSPEPLPLPKAPASAQSPEPLPQPAAAASETAQQALAGWVAAWSSKNFLRFQAYYSKNFAPENGRTVAQWASDRAVLFAKPGQIAVSIRDLKVHTPEAGRAVTEFFQSYASSEYRDFATKRLEWIREDGRWKILREQVLGETEKIWLPSIAKAAAKKRKTSNCNCD